jgi:hypothetical protein
LKNLRVSEYPQHSAQNDIRHTEVPNGLKSLAEPLSKFSMARKIQSLGVDQDVNVD